MSEKKQYSIVTVTRTATPRSKRIQGTGSSGGVTVVGGIQGSPQGGDGGVLSKDINVNAPDTGFIKAGYILRKGMTLEDVFRAMLYKAETASLQGSISTANDVEFGSNKGVLTYTAKRAGNGAMVRAFYDGVEGNRLVFSAEVDGVQTATRALTGVYTAGETYRATVVFGQSDDLAIGEQTLTSTIGVNVRRRWFAGTCGGVPTNSAAVRALASGGLYTGAGSYRFTVSGWTTIAICVPADTVKEITLTAYPGNFLEDGGVCSGPVAISVAGANGSAATGYKMWVIKTGGMNDPDTFTFKTV